LRDRWIFSTFIADSFVSLSQSISVKQLTYLVFAISLTVSLAGCTSIERLLRGTSPLEQFRCNVDAILADSNFTATGTGIKIVSLDNNEVLYERNSKALLRPASNLKLLTTATALSTLGKDFSIKTNLYADTLVTDSTLHGNIYLKGFGDPDFNSLQLAELVSALRWKGISRIEGNIVGDPSYFDDQHWGAGWMWDDEPFGFAAYNSALSINRNCIDVTVSPGTAIDDSAIVIIDPPTHYVSVENEATTSEDTLPSTLEISRRFAERLNVITVKGKIPRAAQPQKDPITIRGPEMYFLTLAKEELERQRIFFNGNILLDTIPARARLIAQHSQPIDSMIVFLNKVSDNLSAENMLKIIGAEICGQPGTTEHGIFIVKQVLNSLGIDTTKFLMVDGSGVSHYNLLTPEIYIQLLRGMYSRKDIFDLYYASLPNAGVDGSLETRMRNSAAQNNLHAKTGTIGGVSTLSGYVRTADGEMLVFSIMMQNYIGASDPYRSAQDAIGILMANLKRK
jgi:D-alanyl-D-alanine carboxypeptidase/D-alanyl-D-alanine-endopeptidase (penicillin-binding protein 4)